MGCEKLRKVGVVNVVALLEELKPRHGHKRRARNVPPKRQMRHASREIIVVCAAAAPLRGS